MHPNHPWNYPGYRPPPPRACAKCRPQRLARLSAAAGRAVLARAWPGWRLTAAQRARLTLAAGSAGGGLAAACARGIIGTNTSGVRSARGPALARRTTAAWPAADPAVLVWPVSPGHPDARL